MHDGMPYGRNQGQGQGHSREVDRQSPTGLILSHCFPWPYKYHFKLLWHDIATLCLSTLKHQPTNQLSQLGGCMSTRSFSMQRSELYH